MKSMLFKAESNFVINKTFKLMIKPADLTFSPEGHTVRDSGDNLNLTLSEAFAQSVIDRLIRIDISANVLKDTSWSENKRKLTPSRKMISRVSQN